MAADLRAEIRRLQARLAGEQARERIQNMPRVSRNVRSRAAAANQFTLAFNEQASVMGAAIPIPEMPATSVNILEDTLEEADVNAENAQAQLIYGMVPVVRFTVDPMDQITPSTVRTFALRGVALLRRSFPGHQFLVVDPPANPFENERIHYMNRWFARFTNNQDGNTVEMRNYETLRVNEAGETYSYKPYLKIYGYGVEDSGYVNTVEEHMNFGLARTIEITYTPSHGAAGRGATRRRIGHVDCSEEGYCLQWAVRYAPRYVYNVNDLYSPLSIEGIIDGDYSLDMVDRYEQELNKYRDNISGLVERDENESDHEFLVQAADTNALMIHVFRDGNWTTYGELQGTEEIRCIFILVQRTGLTNHAVAVVHPHLILNEENYLSKLSTIAPHCGACAFPVRRGTCGTHHYNVSRSVGVAIFFGKNGIVTRPFVNDELFASMKTVFDETMSRETIPFAALERQFRESVDDLILIGLGCMDSARVGEYMNGNLNMTDYVYLDKFETNKRVRLDQLGVAGALKFERALSKRLRSVLERGNLWVKANGEERTIVEYLALLGYRVSRSGYTPCLKASIDFRLNESQTVRVARKEDKFVCFDCQEELPIEVGRNVKIISSYGCVNKAFAGHVCKISPKIKELEQGDRKEGEVLQDSLAKAWVYDIESAKVNGGAQLCVLIVAMNVRSREVKVFRGRSSMRSFVLWLRRDEEMRGSTLIAHNGGKFDSQFVFSEYLQQMDAEGLEFGKLPSFVQDSLSQFTAWRMQCHDEDNANKGEIRFIDTMTWILPTSLNKLAAALTVLDEEKNLMQKQDFDVRLITPELFDAPNDTADTCERYCIQDCAILAGIVQNFVTMMKSLTAEMFASCDPDSIGFQKLQGGVDPMQFNTAAALGQHLSLASTKHVIRTTQNLAASCAMAAMVRSTHLGAKYLEDIGEPLSNLQVRRNGPLGPSHMFTVAGNRLYIHIPCPIMVALKKKGPDGQPLYPNVSGTLGRFWVRDPRSCPCVENPDLIAKDLTHVDRFFERHAGKELHFVSCKHQQDDMLPTRRPLCKEQPLVIAPRLSYYGGRTEAFSMKYVCKPGERLAAADVASMYPWAYSTQAIPFGQAEFHGYMDAELVSRQILSNDIIGMLDVVIEINPEVRPVLMQQTETKLVAAGVNMEDPSSNELRGVYTTVDLKTALERGYRITYVYAAMLYPEDQVASQGLWPEFCRFFYQKKEAKVPVEMRKNGVLQTVTLQLYKDLCKLPLNACYGRYCVKPKDSTLSFVNDNTAGQMIQSMWKNPRFEFAKIKFRAYPGDNVATDARRTQGYRQRYLATPESDRKTMEKPLGGNISVVKCPVAIADVETEISSVHIGSFITAYARRKLYTGFEAVEESGGRPLYCDTDSIMFATSLTNEQLVEQGVLHNRGKPCGDWSFDLKEGEAPTRFLSFGAKFYALYDERGKVCKLKIKGCMRQSLFGQQGWCFSSKDGPWSEEMNDNVSVISDFEMCRQMDNHLTGYYQWLDSIRTRDLTSSEMEEIEERMRMPAMVNQVVFSGAGGKRVAPIQKRMGITGGKGRPVLTRDGDILMTWFGSPLDDVSGRRIVKEGETAQQLFEILPASSVL